MANNDATERDPLRDLVQEAFGDAQLTDERGCPSAEWWYEFESGLTDSTQDDDASAFAAHAESCARCSAERTLARTFLEQQQLSTGHESTDKESPAADHGNVVVPFRPMPSTTPSEGGALPARNRRVSGWLAAAAVVLAFAGTYSVTRSRAPEIRTPGDGLVMRSQVIEGIQPTGSLVQVPSRFEWSDRNQLGEYRLVVVRVDGRMVFESTVEGSGLTLSAEQLEQLQPFVRYRWTVESTAANGSTVRSLPLDFRIRPQPVE